MRQQGMMVLVVGLCSLIVVDVVLEMAGLGLFAHLNKLMDPPLAEEQATVTLDTSDSQQQPGNREAIAPAVTTEDASQSRKFDVKDVKVDQTEVIDQTKDTVAPVVKGQPEWLNKQTKSQNNQPKTTASQSVKPKSMDQDKLVNSLLAEYEADMSKKRNDLVDGRAKDQKIRQKGSQSAQSRGAYIDWSQTLSYSMNKEESDAVTPSSLVDSSRRSRSSVSVNQLAATKYNPTAISRQGVPTTNAPRNYVRTPAGASRLSTLGRPTYSAGGSLGFGSTIGTNLSDRRLHRNYDNHSMQVVDNRQNFMFDQRRDYSVNYRNSTGAAEAGRGISPYRPSYLRSNNYGSSQTGNYSRNYSKNYK